MQKQILVSLIAITAILGNLYYFSSDNSAYMEQDTSIPQLTAYEEDIVFDQNACTWNLPSKNIDDVMLESISKTISRRLQSMAPEPIRIFEINLYNNKIKNICPLFEAIYEGLYSTIEQLNVNLSYNSIGDISCLSDWTTPAKMSSFQINLQTISTIKIQSIAGITSIFNRMKLTTTFGVNIQNQNVADIGDLMDKLISSTKKINKLELNFGSNTGKYDSWKDKMVELLGKQNLINHLTLGMENSYINNAYLNKLESKIYNMKYLEEFILNAKSNNLQKSDVQNIFQDLSDKIGQQNVIVYV